MRNYPEIGIQVPDILIPGISISREKWAVVACDQYTSQPDYWEKVRNLTVGYPSAFHIILPEAYLGKPEEKSHESQMLPEMSAYLAAGQLQSIEGFIYVERSFGSKTRQGIVAGLDLEKYDFQKNSQSLIRATEGTVIDRLPPRIKIRENAPIEIPHIMVLIDDPLFSVIEPLTSEIDYQDKLYDFELMLGGGHLRGFLIKDNKLEKQIISALSVLAGNEAQVHKYGQALHPLLYAVGDGNHSLAAAKSYWERIKHTVNSNHPARFALVEIVNVHNRGINFEPIHRLVTGINFDLLECLKSFFSEKVKISTPMDFESMKNIINFQKNCPQLIGSINGGLFRLIELQKPVHTLPVGSLQIFLDDLQIRHPEIVLDYIHGEKALLQLAEEPKSMGFFLPAMDKSNLFRSVINDGPLPRKTFSMGEAHEKRYYFECRKIRTDEN